jgi:malonyl-CoA/methylmalonyl-CoA synthetase
VTAGPYALFLERLAGHEDSVVLDAPDGVWTYRALHDLAARFSTLLAEAGAAQGDRIVVQAEKSPAVVALYLACLRSGVVFTPLNTAYTPVEVSFFLSDAAPRILVCRPGDVAALSPIAKAAGVPHVWPLGLAPAAGAWAAARAARPSDKITFIQPDDLAAILYTSGTTGRSKGAMITHRNLASNALSLHRIWGFAPGDVLLHALPIFHVHGLFVALNTAFLNASRILFLPKFDAAEVRRRLSEATVMMGVPTFYTRLLEEPDLGRAECAHMRLFVSGSAPLTAQASDAWFDRTGHRILERYGMTECGMITSNPLVGDRVAGTVGFALPDVEVRVCDGEGRELPRGEVGVIEVRGPNVFKGYWRAAEKTAEDVRPNGFFITGDVATMDAEGRVAIVGRAKDVIISGGFNIYPREIELVLDAVPGVKESAIVGASHPDLGEGVVAVLVAEGPPIPDATLESALAGALARFKHPRRFIWVEALPRNAMGKVAKNELRAQVADAYA